MDYSRHKQIEDDLGCIEAGGDHVVSGGGLVELTAADVGLSLQRGESRGLPDVTGWLLG